MALNDSGWYHGNEWNIPRRDGIFARIEVRRDPQIDRFANVRNGSWFAVATGKQMRNGEERREAGVESSERRSVRRCRDVGRLCVAFYEFLAAKLALLFEAKGEWDKVKPYSSQVLFKFSSPLSTSCAPSPLCAPRRGWFRGKKVAPKICKIAWPHAVLPRRGPSLPSVRNFSRGTVLRSLNPRNR